MLNTNRIRIFFTFILLVVLSACGGDGSTPLDVDTGSTINASYIKGPVDGASATLLDANGNVVAGPVTTVDGLAIFTGVTYEGLVYTSFSGGTYTDEATGVTVVLDSSVVMRSGVIDSTAGGTLEIAGTPLTEIAFQRAEAAATGTLDLSSVSNFLAAVADEFGLDGINLATVMPTPLADIAGISESDLYGATLAAITQQQLNAGITTPVSADLVSYLSDVSANGLDETTFSTAVNDLATNPNTSSTIDSTITSAIETDVGSDTTSPVITLTGVSTQIIEVGESYTELGATASDNVDGNITANIIINSSAVNTSAVGSYSVTYTVSDVAGNVASTVTRTVSVVNTPTVLDTTNPVITLTGTNPQTIELSAAYVELGATASDNVDGDLTANIIINSSAVNTNAVGSYSVTYTVSDAAGNVASTVSRTVSVVDTTPVLDTTNPVITLTGSNPQTIELNDTYVELGATASDDTDGDVTADIVIGVGDVDTSAVGSYSVTYNVSDEVGNAADTMTRTVNVVDTTIPVITLSGSNPQLIEINSAYTESGATASDNVDGNITADITIDASAVDAGTLGDYSVDYDVMDAAGNSATTVTRTVRVYAAGTDVTAPVAVITFPTLVSTTDGDSVTVRGTTSDESEVTVVRVNGLDVTSSDNYANWEVTVSLIVGNNTLTVETADIAQNFDYSAASAQIKLEPSFNGSESHVLDSVHNRVLFVDSTNKAIIAVDLETGNRSIFSDATTPNATNLFTAPIAITLDSVLNRALVYDYSGYLYSVSLVNGQRSILSQHLANSQPTVNSPKSIAFDRARNRVLLATRQSIHQISLTDGVRTRFSDYERPNGIYYPTSITGIVMDDANNRALVSDGGTVSPRVLAVNLSSDANDGSRTLISDNNNPVDSSNAFFHLFAIAFDSAKNRVLVVDFDNIKARVMAVSLIDGSRSIISDETTPNTNNMFALPRAMQMDAGNNRVLLFDPNQFELMSVDLTEGEDEGARTIISSNSFPEVGGDKIWYDARLAIDDATNRLFYYETYQYAISSYARRIVAANLNTGIRSLISDRTTPDANVPFYNSGAMVIDGDRALVGDRSNRVLSVDLTSGARSYLSVSGVPDAINNFTSARDIALDSNNGRAFVIDSYKTVMEVSLADGARTILSDADTNIPDAVNAFSSATDIAVDSDNGRLLVVDETLDVIMAVDLADGARSIFSDNSTPNMVNSFGQLGKIVMDTANNRALVLNDSVEVIAVSLTDGSRTVISSNSIPNTSNDFTSTVDIDLDSSNNRAMVLTGDGKIIAVDLVNGHRVVFIQ